MKCSTKPSLHLILKCPKICSNIAPFRTIAHRKRNECSNKNGKSYHPNDQWKKLFDLIARSYIHLSDIFNAHCALCISSIFGHSLQYFYCTARRNFDFAHSSATLNAVPDRLDTRYFIKILLVIVIGLAVHSFTARFQKAKGQAWETFHTNIFTHILQQDEWAYDEIENHSHRYSIVHRITLFSVRFVLHRLSSNAHTVDDWHFIIYQL